MRRVEIAPGGHHLRHGDGGPFFWLADTGWLLLSRLTREEAAVYLDDRRRRGFNVVQAMLLPGLPCRNAYGWEPCADLDPARPLAGPARDGYWEHVDFVLDLAAERGMHLALVPAWGAVVRRGHLTAERAAAYGAWLGRRYRGAQNVFWLNGGDERGDRNPDVWHALGNALKEADPDHLMTFHPFGRTRSAQWFADAPWLDFHMCQSGHQRYDQTAPGDGPGEDNWRYIAADYGLAPPRPALDGEPSYEGIPQGLHDPAEPFWEDRDCRRYAHWAVFAGACGHTYGHGSVMQMHAPGRRGAYGVTRFWTDCLGDPGADQMRHLKDLILSRPFFERVPDDRTVAGDAGERHERLLATRGASFAFVYTYTGRPFAAALGVLPGSHVRVTWHNPRDGSDTAIGVFPNAGRRTFTPPGTPAEGNDWVLVLDAADSGPAPQGRATDPGPEGGR